MRLLEEFGLSKVESKVFSLLIEWGPCPAGTIIDKSGLQNAVVHRAFRSLISKGLVTFVLHGKRKEYNSIDLEQLLLLYDEKREQLVKSIKELEEKKKKNTKTSEARVFKGAKGVRNLLHYMISVPSSKYLSYGGNSVADDFLGHHFWENFHRRRIAQKIKGKMLFTHSLRWWANELNTFPYTQVRTTKRNFEELTETIICGKKVAIIVWLEVPFGFLIEEEAAARSYRKFFEILWATGKQ